MSPLRSLGFLGFGRPNKRLLRPPFRLEGLEDRTVPIVGKIISYSPKPIVIGQPAHVKVEGSDGINFIANFTDSVTIYTYPDMVFLGTHQFVPEDHGVFNIPVVVPLGTAPGALSIDAYDDNEATNYVSSVNVSDTGGNAFNLALDNVEVPANDEVTSGEKTKIYLNLSNDGSSACRGQTTAHVTLGTDTIDVPINVNIKPGGTERLPVKLTMPKLNLSGVEELDPGNYDPQVAIDAIDGETNTGDNSATAANPIEYAFRFGHITEDAGQAGMAFGPSLVKLPSEVLKTVDGETFKMHGSGYATLIKSAGGWDLKFSNDADSKTDSTSWAESTGGKKFTLTSITADGPIAGLFMLDATAIGDLNFNGGLASSIGIGPGFTLGNLGQASAATSVTIAHIDGGKDAGIAVGEKDTPGSGIIQKTTINAADGIGFLAAGKAWLGGGSIVTPFVTTIMSGGDFSPDITVTNPGKDGDGIHEAIIKGQVRGNWNAAPGGSSIGIAEVTADSASNWIVTADGNIKRASINRDWDVGGISANAIGTLDVKGSLLIGDIHATGAFLDANGNNLDGIQTIRVGKTLQATDVIADVASIGKLSAAAWPTYVNRPQLKAFSIGTINVPGKFDASIDMTDTTAKASAKSINVGTVSGASGNQLGWVFESSVGSIKVGSLSYASIAVTGNIGLFTQPSLPNVTVQFSNSLVSAGAFGLILVRNVDPANSQPSGFKASKVLSYHRFAGHALSFSQGVTTAAGTYDSGFGQYSLQIT